MVSLSTTDLSLLNEAQVAISGVRATRRRISPQAGRALELLGHAIDYLTDEYVHEGGTFAPDDAQWRAIQLLIATNRQIYFECPEVPTLTGRILGFLNRGGAQASPADGSGRPRSSRAA